MGALGGGLGAIWAPKAVWHGKKNQMPKNDRVGAPILGSIFDMFRYFSMFLCILFLVSIFMATRIDFSWILMFVGSFLKAFFISFRIVGKQGKCHSDKVFTLFKVHRPPGKEQKHRDFKYIFGPKNTANTYLRKSYAGKENNLENPPVAP